MSNELVQNACDNGAARWERWPLLWIKTKMLINPCSTCVLCKMPNLFDSLWLASTHIRPFRCRHFRWFSPTFWIWRNRRLPNQHTRRPECASLDFYNVRTVCEIMQNRLFIERLNRTNRRWGSLDRRIYFARFPSLSCIGNISDFPPSPPTTED